MDADTFNDSGATSLAILMKDGNAHRVHLTFRKCEDAPVRRRRFTRPLKWNSIDASMRPEASPPRSPQEQRRKADAVAGLRVTSLAVSSNQTDVSANQGSGVMRCIRSGDEMSPERLWKRLKKRLGSATQWRRMAAWVAGEASEAHGHCLRAASDPARLLLLRPRFTIRAPVPWHQQFLIARQYNTHNLFTTHPVMVDLRRSWNQRYSLCLLFDESWDRTTPPDPYRLLDFVEGRCRRLKESLVDQWIPECHVSLMRLKPTWLSMVPLKNGESLQQIRRFFQSLSRLLSLQIRRLLHGWIVEWTTLTYAYQGDNRLDGHYSDKLFRLEPLLRLELTPLDQQIRFNPPLDHVHQLLERCLRCIVDVSDGIPRVEQLLLPEYRSDDRWLDPVAWNEQYVQAVRRDVQNLVDDNRHGPETYVRLEYHCYENILQHRFSRTFEDDQELDWNLRAQKFRERIQTLDELSQKLRLLKPFAYLKLYHLDCEQLNRLLRQCIATIRTNLVASLIQENKKLLREISNRFEVVTEKVNNIPKTTQELVELIDFVRQSQTEIFPELIVQVEAAGKRLLFLLDYTILSKEDIMSNCRLFRWPSDLDSVVNVSSTRLQMARVHAEKALRERTAKFLDRLVEYGAAMDTIKNKEAPNVSMEEMRTSSALLDALHRNLQAAKDEANEINRDERLLDWPLTLAPQLHSLIEYIEPYYQLWHVAYHFHLNYDVWFHGPFKELDSKQVATETDAMHAQIVQLGIDFAGVPGPKKVADVVQKRIEKFRTFVPLLHAVCNAGLRERHWLAISQDFESPLRPAEDTTLSELVTAGLFPFLERVEEVSLTATKEFALEQTLQRMQAEWNDIRFEYVPYRDSDLCVLTGVEEIQALVDDHILRSQTMHASPYVMPLEPILHAWEERLVTIQDTMDVWLKVQNTWLYLEPIFSSEDIQRQMPSDAAKFSQVDKIWRSLMSSVTDESRVLIAAGRQGLLDDLRLTYSMLEDIQKGLHDYLERKRVFFSRFYFLSNDELLEILSKTKEPERIQPHLRKCFDGINRLVFTRRQEIEAMVSAENEMVRFRDNIVPAKSKGMVELWMAEVATRMKDSLVHCTDQALQQWTDRPQLPYLRAFPGQCIYCASALHWTRALSQHLTGGVDQPPQWQALEETVQGTLKHLISLTDACNELVVRVTLNNLIVYYIQGLETVRRLKAKNVSSVQDYHWLSLIRHYWDTSDVEEPGNMLVAMVDTQIQYGFEYMGCTFRLILTPATEKAFRVMMLALKQYQGVWLYGDQGVGKTETIKELAWMLAKQCLVFNCFEDLESTSVGRILKGVAQSGAWACFDYVDRVAADVISVSAVQIQTLLTALACQLKRIMFEGSDIFLSSGCALFVTTNTSDGLADNFKTLFRPTMMTAPDLHFVVETSLLALGIADHVHVTDRLLELLDDGGLGRYLPAGSPQSAYNLRSVKELLKTIERCKVDAPRAKHSSIVHHAFMAFVRPQLDDRQSGELQRSVERAFPADHATGADLAGLSDMVDDVCRELRLEPSRLFARKVHELFEALNARNGVILLGAASVGKTTLYKILARTYPKLLGSTVEDGRVVYHAISPWSMPSKQLYGYHDEGKQMWHDGIITKTLRELSANCPTSPRWMILDGYLHTELVCHLHTLLDASRKLTLPSGEILQIPPSLRLIFETCDLSYASPSTVSRCHVVRVTDDVVPVEALNRSWLARAKLGEEHSTTADAFLHLIVRPCIEFSGQQAEHCAFVLAASYLFQSYTRLVSSLLTNQDTSTFKDDLMLRVLTFAVVWTIGAAFKHEERGRFDVFLRRLLAQVPRDRRRGSVSSASSSDMSATDRRPPLPWHQALPEQGSAFDYWLNVAANVWSPWRDAFDTKQLRTGADLMVGDMVMANDSVAVQHFFMHTYSNGGVPTLVVGGAGVGKSAVSEWIIRNLPKDRYVNNIIHMTPATSSAFMQSSIMTGLDRRRKGVYGPALGRRCVLFIDDLASCHPVHGFIRSPLELIRHWLNYESMFDCQTALKIEFVDMQLVVAARYAHPFHQEIDPRLMRHMNLIYLKEPGVQDLDGIFSTILENHLAVCAPPVSRITKMVSLATIDLYWRWKANVDEQQRDVSHYIMGVSCIARVCQGVMTVPVARITDAIKLHRLWIHQVCYVWGDRLTSAETRALFLQHMNEVSQARFKLSVDKYLYSTALGTPDYNFLPKIYFSHLGAAKNDPAVFDEVKEIDELVLLMENQLEGQQSGTTRPWMKMIISVKVATCVLHISQSLHQRRCHVILIGDAGSGRRSCALLAAGLLNFQVYQIKAGRSYGSAEWKEDMKHLIRLAGVDKTPTLFLATASTLPSKYCFDHLARLMTGYEISDLFTNEERSEMLELYQRTYKENAKYSQIFRNVRDNLRIALCVAPSDGVYGQLALYPATFKYSSILWFESWPDETLEAIARKWLEDVPGFAIDDAADSVDYVRFFKSVHKYMRQVNASDERNVRYSSATYLDLIVTFRQLWQQKEKELLLQKERYMAGLSKLQFAASQVTVMQDELRRLQPQLVDTSAETESLMVKIEQDTIEVEAQKEVIAADEALANEAAAAAQAIKDECESDLTEATPALEAAIQALDTLKPADITLVKSMRHPPSIVKLVMESVCVMKQISPVKKPDRGGTGKMTDDYWPAAQKLLGDLKFLDLLRAYDKDNIPTSVMRKIREKYIPNPEFDPVIVRHVSAACEGLCRWVRAMEVYDRVIKIVAPKRAKLKEAEQELARQMARLSEKHHQLQQITDKLQALNDDFAAMSKKKKDLEDSINQCRQKMLRAEKLIGGLGGEQQQWKNTADQLGLRLKWLPGDVLLSASFITYLGAASHQFRQDSMKQWLEMIDECCIPYTPHFKLVDCLVDAVRVRAWNIAGLPSDGYSLDNGIIAIFSHRWPLLIDPQEQGLKWITEIESANHVVVVRYNDPAYLAKLVSCLREGHTLVVTNIEGKLDPELENVLEKRTVHSADGDGQELVTVGAETVVWAAKFRLYFITRDRTVVSSQELTSKFTVVDFTLSRAGLEDKLLSLFLSSERPELEERKQSLVVQGVKNQKQLRDLEDRILRVLSNSRGNILEDETATRTLYMSKVHSEEIHVKQKDIQKSEAEIDAQRQGYRPIAVHAASLYDCIGRMKNLNHIYQFSLTWFISLFTKSSLESGASKLASERVVLVNNYFTQVLHASVNRSLFQKDRLLFTCLFAIATLGSKQEVMPETIQRLFDLTPRPEAADQPPGPMWIDAAQWRCLVELSSDAIGPFAGLAQHVESFPRLWKRFCGRPAEVKMALPGPWHELQLLDQLLVVKHMKPDGLKAAFQDMISTTLGPTYLEYGLSDDLSSVYDESRPSTAILCFVAGNSNPIPNIISLGDFKLESKNRVKLMPMGRGTESATMAFVQKCAMDGTWAVLQNCHLFPKVLEVILDELANNQKRIHSEFRLWFVGYSSPHYTAPTLQNCVKTVSEPASCYRDALLQILSLDLLVNKPASRLASADPNLHARAASADRLSKEAKLKFSQDWNRISLAISSFHALLLEHHRYHSVGPAAHASVEFTFNDLKSALTLTRDVLLSSRDVTFESLRLFVIECVYRAQMAGHDGESDVLQLFIDQLLTANLLHDEAMVVSLCHRFQLPLAASRRTLFECVRNLPTDLGPAAVGLSKQFVKQLDVQESAQVLEKLALCYGPTAVQDYTL